MMYLHSEDGLNQSLSTDVLVQPIRASSVAYASGNAKVRLRIHGRAL
ncbi:hypothetical protein JD969_13000 [Planctomycetota bacterium]|nr:hypothetical protein JD969_13000 [Planctomycetota bacterium]